MESNGLLVAIACLAVFMVMALLMFSRRLSALLALPVMAFAIAVIGGIPPADILSDVLSKGATKLNGAYTTTMFGAVLAELLNKQGIAKSLIRWVAEFSGDNPYLLGIIMTAVTAVLFSTLGGLGAVIMVGTVALPVMLSIGIPAIVAGALYLFGISLGGMFNFSNWQLYIDVLKIDPAMIRAFVLPFATVLAQMIFIFLFVELRKKENFLFLVLGTICNFAFLFYSSQAQGKQPSTVLEEERVFSYMLAMIILGALVLFAGYRQIKKITDLPGIAMLTPIIPLILVLFGHWDFIPAFIAGTIYGVLTTWQANAINQLTRSIIDGITNVIPAVFLMIGIGMLLNAVMHPKVAGAISPMLAAIVPTHALPYILIFTLIAPFSLYRGPLSLWGMGSGLVALVQKATSLGAPAIMGMLMSVGQIQGVCDPTNTHNIWIATYLGTDTQALLKKTIFYVWITVFLGLGLACFFGYVPW